MSGGGGGVIILKMVKDSMQVGLNKSGSVKLWHVLALTHVLSAIAGAVLF